MSCEVPHVPLSCNDLRAMGAIVTAYGTSLPHGVPPSPKRERVKTWLCERNLFVQQHARTGQPGARIIPCWLLI